VWTRVLCFTVLLFGSRAADIRGAGSDPGRGAVHLLVWSVGRGAPAQWATRGREPGLAPISPE
jgi:hypothetical protein